jgi:hypothetical protein
MKPTIYLLFGYPATGKLTIAKELDRLIGQHGGVSRLVDNHYVNNPVFNLIDADGRTPLPRAAWDRVAQVRNALAETVETLSPQEWSFIFTNHLVDGDEDWEWFSRLERIAKARGNVFAPVRLLCSLDELVRRVQSPDRHGMKKLIDPDWLRRHYGQVEVLDPGHPDMLTLDVTDLAPEESARLILEHVDRARAD